MTPPVSDNPPAALDTDRRLTFDLACVNCGYNLRTIRLEGICPECGSAVADSTRHYLRFAPWRWVESLSGGAALVLASVVGAVLVALLMWLLAAPRIGYAEHWFAILARSFLAGLGLVALLTCISGLLFLTKRNPRHRNGWEGLSARRLTRVCLLLPVIVVLCAGLVPSLLPEWWPLGGPRELPRYALWLILLVMLPLALLRHLAALMRQIPHGRLVRFAVILFWFAVCLAMIWVSVDVIRHRPSLVGLSTGSPILVVLEAVWPHRLYAAGVVYMAGFVLMFIAQRALARALRQARTLAADGLRRPRTGIPLG
jgi:hypothetical protein